MKRFISAFTFLLLIAPAGAKIITVDDDGPANYSRIQDAIDNSHHGDTIIVKTGAYNENIHFKGRAITLTTDPNDPQAVQSTTITANSDYSVTFDWGEGPNSVLAGFTLTGRGIRCVDTSPTIFHNVITQCENDGIVGTSFAAPTLYANTISFNNGRAIVGCNGLIGNNIIRENAGGIAFCNGQITANIIRENSDNYGGGIYHCNADIVGNLIANNSAAYDGGGLWTCGMNISRNLITANTAGRNGGGLFNCSGSIKNNIITANKAQNGGGLYNCGADIFNNTIVANIATNQGGALNKCSGSIYNNIIAFNQANPVGGIYGFCHNSYNDFWDNGLNFGAGADKGPGDIQFNPRFAVNGYWDVNSLWVNGDYHLKSEAGRWNPTQKNWVLDTQTSQCIDAGNPSSDWTGELWPHGQRLNLGAYGGTPQASMSMSKDNNVANLTDEPEPQDWVDYDDLMLFSAKWLCTLNELSSAGNDKYQTMLQQLWQAPLAEDLDRNGQVNFLDFAVFAALWQPAPPLPPNPNPMTWFRPPEAISETSIQMQATTATSTDGSSVQYRFWNTTLAVYSPWQNEPNYTDTNLVAETEYCYKVMARNKGNLMQTSWSETRCVSTFVDSTPPEPDPAQWLQEPHALSATSIRMVAEQASDPSGVQYYFQCTKYVPHKPKPGDPNDPNLYSSAWQDSPLYEVNVPKGLLAFVVRARDRSPRHNTTADSIQAAVDLKPPTPDPMDWAEGGKPQEILLPPYRTFDYGATMTAKEATDESKFVQYYFQCTTEGGFSSGWISDRTYTVKVGRQNQRHRFKVKARDKYGNETGWSDEWPALPP